MARAGGIAGRAIGDTPVAVIDFETTGLDPGMDRVVEVSVVRLDPGVAPRPVLDTLVNPGRPVAATAIHGITDADVADAPRFDAIAGRLTYALAGCVVAAYNVYFDLRFLEYELRRVGLRHSPPHLCLMYLRPMLGLGRRCPLCDACKAHRIPHSGAHRSGVDSLAAARLWMLYGEVIAGRGLRTFGELRALKGYKFLDSLTREPISPENVRGLSWGAKLKSRSLAAEPAPPAPSRPGRRRATPIGAR